MKKVAVVVGGVGIIGYAISQELAKLGYDIVALSRSAESVTNLQKLEELESDAMGINCDISKTYDIENARDTILEKYSGIDVLVNGAGWTKPIAHKDLDGITDEIFDNCVSTNLRGLYATIRTFNKYLNQDSVIINLSSVSADRRGGSSMAYAATKAGVNSLTRNLSVALAPKTRVVGVAPGFVDTGFNSPENHAIALSATPMKRVATATDVAKMVASVITNDFLNGTTIVLDGGRSA